MPPGSRAKANPTSVSSSQMKETVKLDDDVLHFLKNVVQVDTDSSHLAMSLRHHGLTSIFLILFSEDKFIDTMGYLDKNDVFHELAVVDKARLKVLRGLNQMYSTEEEGVSDWTFLTKDIYDKFRISKSFLNMSAQPSVPSAAGGFPKSQDRELDNFKKGLKLDPTQFPVLANDRMWESWNRNALNQAAAQMVLDVFNPRYVPATPAKEKLFRAQQNWVYAMFSNNLKTSRSQEIVCKHSDDERDAQAVYRKLLDFYTKSRTKRELTRTSSLIHYSVGAVFHNKWRGTTVVLKVFLTSIGGNKSGFMRILLLQMGSYRCPQSSR